MSNNTSLYFNVEQQQQLKPQQSSWYLQIINQQIKQDDIFQSNEQPIEQPKLYLFTEYLHIVFNIHNCLRQINKKGQLDIYCNTKISAKDFDKILIKFTNKSDFLQYQFKYIYNDQFHKIICSAIQKQEKMEEILFQEILKLKKKECDLEQDIKVISQLMLNILQNNNE